MSRKYFKKIVLSLFFLFAIYASLYAAESITLPNPAATISMDLKDASIKDVLKIFSIQSGLNFIASESVKDRILTLYLDKVPVLDCMEKIFKANNLSYEKDPNSNIIIVKDWGKPSIQTITKVFVLKYNRLQNSRIEKEIENYLDQTSTTTGTGLSAATGTGTTTGTEEEEITGDEGISASIKKILSEYGKVTEDIRSNSLIVTDIPSNFPIIEQTIAALDVPVPQVLLEVEMLDVAKDKVDKIGFKYGQTPFTIVIKGAHQDMGFPFKHWSKRIGDPTYGQVAINDSTSTYYQVQFDFLRTLTDTKFLARPKILTLSNETAEIKIVTNEAIGVSSTSQTTTGTITGTAERTETGVILRITPQVNLLTGEITMFVMPVVAEASTQLNTFTSGGTAFTFANPETRVSKSIVRVKDGDTVVIGGLIRNTRSEVITKLHIFGDIPVLGAFFRHKSVEPGKERELIVFITPRIVKEAKEEQLAQANSGQTLPEVAEPQPAEANAQRTQEMSKALEQK